MHLYTTAELTDMFMKGGLEPAGPETTSVQPVRGKGCHCRHEQTGIQVGCTEEFQWMSSTTTFGERCAFEHYCSGITAGHPEIGGIGAGIDPGAFAQRPAISRCSGGAPTVHRDDPVVNVETEAVDEPGGKFTKREAMPHRQRTSANETLPPRSQQ